MKYDKKSNKFILTHDEIEILEDAYDGLRIMLECIIPVSDFPLELKNAKPVIKEYKKLKKENWERIYKHEL